jgi:hypothetical protein
MIKVTSGASSSSVIVKMTVNPAVLCAQTAVLLKIFFSRYLYRG